ncbi:serine/threonine-protein kinase [Allonocardiopsis opalescens]|uniref:non-specific serine/threonine protein kinase n=1 Tax=Allonocardiopsis opalescens TaxID=1144618 RepID=A0A2T0PU47_9ACTN|nr:serine/threonine-protein kinase [Allonocardiopsis opalescens]PRX92427.1 serine/threonine protein kinase [Allonocardiopsis opalescens]
MTTEPTPPAEALAGRYRLESLLGSGGMGRVWRGMDELLDREVAVKELTLPPDLGDAERTELRARMLREARSAARLSHPSIVTVYDVVEADNRPWIIMELVRARSLAEVIRSEGPLPPARVAAHARQLLAALSVAHAQGVIHRDIKPGNVLVTGDDRLVLTDFGIALLDGDPTLTRTGVLIGSPAYLAPEQAAGRGASSASDLWSLGATLFASLEGHSPFQRPNPVATLTAIATQDVPPSPSAGPLRPLLDGLLRKAPEERLTVAQAMRLVGPAAEPPAHDTPRPAPPPEPTRPLESAPAPALTGPTTPAAPAVPPPGPGPAAGPASRRPVLVVGAVAAVLAAVLLAGALWLAGRPETGGLEGAGAETSAGPPSASDGTGTAPAEPSGQESPTAAESPAEPGPSDGPAPGMVRHEDPTGFSLDVPEGWSVDRSGSSVFFRDPEGGYLQVDQTTTPADNAREDWEAQEPAISGNFGGYERVSIEEVERPSLERYISAADWEFTFDGSGGRYRAVNRAFHTEERGYALFITGPEDAWPERRELLDRMTDSFQPAG